MFAKINKFFTFYLVPTKPYLMRSRERHMTKQEQLHRHRLKTIKNIQIPLVSLKRALMKQIKQKLKVLSRISMTLKTQILTKENKKNILDKL